jgi:mitogen-activated protein kinase organizer 1
MDTTTGKMLNSFSGHDNGVYRCRACFGHVEATVVCGVESGAVWAWDLLDVGFNPLSLLIFPALTVFAQAKLMQPNPPPKVHEKVITWTEHHPTESGEMLTASADGTVKVWRHPALPTAHT